MMEEKQEPAKQETSKLEKLKKFAFDFDSDEGKLNRQIVSTGNLFASIGHIVVWPTLLVSSFGVAIYYGFRQFLSTSFISGASFTIIATLSAIYLLVLFAFSFHIPILRKNIFKTRHEECDREALKKNVGKYISEYGFLVITPFVFLFLFVASMFFGVDKIIAMYPDQQQLKPILANYTVLAVSNFAFACLSLILALIETGAFLQNVLFKFVLLWSAIFNPNQASHPELPSELPID